MNDLFLTHLITIVIFSKLANMLFNVHTSINIYKTLTSVPSRSSGRNGWGGEQTAKYSKNGEKGGGLAAPERASMSSLRSYAQSKLTSLNRTLALLAMVCLPIWKFALFQNFELRGLLLSRYIMLWIISCSLFGC